MIAMKIIHAGPIRIRIPYPGIYRTPDIFRGAVICPRFREAEREDRRGCRDGAGERWDWGTREGSERLFSRSVFRFSHTGDLTGDWLGEVERDVPDREGVITDCPGKCHEPQSIADQ
jgi:hypothetical protein